MSTQRVSRLVPPKTGRILPCTPGKELISSVAVTNPVTTGVLTNGYANTVETKPYVAVTVNGHSRSSTASQGQQQHQQLQGRTDDKQRSAINAHIQIYSEWANHYLQKRRNCTRLISNLQSDLSDGVLLAQLIEAVVGEKVIEAEICQTPNKSPLSLIEACLTFLTSRGVTLDGIRPKDVHCGSLPAILGLLYNLSHYKQRSKQLTNDKQRSSSANKQSPHLNNSATDYNTNMPTRLPSPFSNSRVPADVNTTDDNNCTISSRMNVKLATTINNNIGDDKSHHVAPPPPLPPRSSSTQLDGPNSRIPTPGSTRKHSDAGPVSELHHNVGTPRKYSDTGLASLSTGHLDPASHQVSKLKLINARNKPSAAAGSESCLVPAENHNKSATGSRPPAGGHATRDTSSAGRVARDVSSASSSRSARIPSRSLPRSQATVRSGRRSVEPVASRQDDKNDSLLDGSSSLSLSSVVCSAAGNISGSGSNTGSSTSVADSVKTEGRRPSASRLVPPSSHVKSSRSLSRPATPSTPTTPSGGGSVSKIATASSIKKTASRGSSDNVGTARSQSAARPANSVVTAPGRVVMVTDGSDCVTMKSSVASVRQLSNNGHDMSTDVNVDSSPVVCSVAAGGCMELNSKRRTSNTGSVSRMPRLHSAAPTHSSTSAHAPISVSSTVGNTVVTMVTSDANTDRADVLTASTDIATSIASPVMTSSDNATTPPVAVTSPAPSSPHDASTIKPMQPMSRAYFTGSSFTTLPPGCLTPSVMTSVGMSPDVSGSCNSNYATSNCADESRLLSASRRPFLPLTGRTAGIYATLGAGGYMSDSDARSSGQRYSGYLSEGYMSEGGVSSLYARRGENKFRAGFDGLRQNQLETTVADDDDDDSFGDNDYSSVTSADIDNTISDDNTSQDGDHHVTSSAPNNHVIRSRDDLTADCRPISKPSFERGSSARATLPATLGGELLSGRLSRRCNQTTRVAGVNNLPPGMALVTDADQKHRSKSANRTPRKDPSSTAEMKYSPGKVSPGYQSPIATSSPNASLKLLKTGKQMAPVLGKVVDGDDGAMKGERLSNYQNATLLRSNGKSLLAGRGGSDRLLGADQHYPVSGRMSVDSALSPNVIRNGGQEELMTCPLPVRDLSRAYVGGGGYRQQKSITPSIGTGSSPYNECSPGSVLRARLPSSTTGSRQALSDVEGASYMAYNAAGQRSLPRNGSSWNCGGSSLLYPDHTSTLPYTSDSQSVNSNTGLGSLAHPLFPTHYQHSGSPAGHLSKISSSSDNILHGSSLSLGSNSSVYSTAEDFQAHEIYKLRHELEAAQAKISSLSSHLNTNAHVVFAFEQSLVNMTHRLQQLAATTDQKDAELNDMRTIIDSLRQQNDINIQRTTDNAGDSSGSAMRRHMSSDSVISGCSSQPSLMMSQIDIDRKKKKHRNWLTSFGKAFSRKKKLGSVSDADSDTSSLYADASLIVANCSSSPARGIVAPTVGSGLSVANDATVIALQEQLHEKDMRLTDVQLEALSSAHQLQQMQDTINRMQSEMLSLRVDNERLNHLVTHKVQQAGSDPGILVSPTKHRDRGIIPSVSSPDMLLTDVSNYDRNCQPVTLSVHLTAHNKVGSIRIGKLNLDRTQNWDQLTETICQHFNEYLSELDPSASLGLSDNSIHSFSIGDLVVIKGMTKPDLLPCGYLVGDSDNISISLRDAEQQSVDALVYDTLVPKSIVQRYVSLLMEHRRIILCGSSGTGKTYLARRLAEHLIVRCGKCMSSDSIATFCIDNKSSRELRPYLLSVAEKCEQKSADLPQVIILDGLHHVASSLGDTFNGFLSVDCHSSPYIIGVMNQATGSTTNLQLHHNFRWVLCANHMEPVQGFLGRYLRRRLLDAHVHTDEGYEDLERVVEWIPQVWQHLNKLLETHNSTDVTIGPRLFLSCPMNAAYVPEWFIDLWNYSIVPYLLDAVREGIQSYGSRAAWEDPTDWIMSTCPWGSHRDCDWSTLQHIRPEDIGCEGLTTGTTTSRAAARTNSSADNTDPLMTMLLQLQDAANCSTVQMINNKLANNSDITAT